MLCCAATVFCQYNAEVFSPANGLVDAKVNRIYQDSLGRLIFLTRDGASVYDGKQIKNYTEADGVTIGVTAGLIEFSEDDLLILTLGHIAFRLQKGRLTADTSLFRACNEVHDAFPVGPGQWVVESSEGFFLLNGQKLHMLLPFAKTNQFSNWSTEGIGCTDSLIFFSEARPEGPLLYAYNWRRKKMLYRFTPPQGSLAFSVHNGQLYFLHKQNICRLMPQSNAGVTTEVVFTLPESLLRKGSIIGIKHGRFWLQQTRGILSAFELDGSGRKIYEFDLPGKVTSFHGLLQDREQNLWLLATGIGAVQLSPVRFKEITQFGYVHSLIKWKDSLQILSNSGIVYQKTKTATKAAATMPAGAWPFSFVCGGTTWFATKRGLQSAEGKVIPLPGIEIEGKYYFAGRSQYDEAGNALLSGYHFIRFSPQQKVHLYTLPYYSDNIVAAGKNVYWAFCRSDHVLKMKIEGDSIRLLRQWLVKGLNPRYAWAKDSSHFLIGTRKSGIVFLKEAEGQLTVEKQLGPAQGLSNYFVSFITALNDSSFAISTSSGLDLLQLRGTDTIIEKISAPDHYFNQIAETELLGDSLFVKSIDARLFVFRPEPLHRQLFKPRLVLSKIEVNGDVLTTEKTEFPYRQNNFRFEASAASFINSREIQFEFVLRNADRQWVKTGNQPLFEINNLEPGDYRLQVRVSFPAKRYPDQVLHYAFTVQKPFWQTVWFRLLFICTVITTIVLLVKSFYVRKFNRQKTLLEKKQAVEKERNRIATDMHDDLGAGLSRIKFLSERLKFQHQSTPISSELNKISAYSDEMAEKMGEIVWALNQRFDSAGDLVAFCRAYASEFLAEKNIALQFQSDVEGDRVLNGETRRNIFLAIKEALNNIAKHSGATEVQMQMKVAKGLYISIADNGSGFDIEKLRPFANGVENMKKRMAEIGGTLEFLNNNGTVVVISLEHLP